MISPSACLSPSCRRCTGLFWLCIPLCAWLGMAGSFANSFCMFSAKHGHILRSCGWRGLNSHISRLMTYAAWILSHQHWAPVKGEFILSLLHYFLEVYQNIKMLKQKSLFSALERNVSTWSLQRLVVWLCLCQPASRLECFFCSSWSGGIHLRTRAPLNPWPPFQPLHRLSTFTARRRHPRTSKSARSAGKCAPMTPRWPLQAMCFVTSVYMCMLKPITGVPSLATLQDCSTSLKYTHLMDRLVKFV